MGIIEEVQSLKASGSSDTQIAEILESRGYPTKDIMGALANNKIRDAVSSDSFTQDQGSQDMQPSLMSQGGMPQTQEYQQYQD